MRLYTIQPLRFWEEAQAKGVMTPDPSLVEQDFISAYDWMCEQMGKRLPSFSGDYPIWAWLKRPDLSFYACILTDEPHVMLTLEVPDERILVSDYETWHYILNGWFVSISEAEFDYAEVYPPTSEEIKRSWERIFDDALLTGWCSTGRKQACIDRLYPHEVVGVTPIRQQHKRKGQTKSDHFPRTEKMIPA